MALLMRHSRAMCRDPVCLRPMFQLDVPHPTFFKRPKGCLDNDVFFSEKKQRDLPLEGVQQKQAPRDFFFTCDKKVRLLFFGLI